MLQKKLKKGALCWKKLDDGDSNFGDLPKVPKKLRMEKAEGAADDWRQEAPGRRLAADEWRQTIGGRRSAKGHEWMSSRAGKDRAEGGSPRG